MQYASLAYGGMATPELKTALKQWQHQRPQYYTKQKVAITQHTLGFVHKGHPSKRGVWSNVGTCRQEVKDFADVIAG